MANTTSIDCSKFASRTSFPNYIATIRSVTANNLTLVDHCKSQVCNALWGSGNPDISGIGMIVGYTIENTLGFCLVLALYLLRRKESHGQRSSNVALLDRYLAVTTLGCSTFHDCAVFFTFSIQLACIVVLSRLDFGISANGMGDSTAKITRAISLLTMLPIMYVPFNPELLRERSANARISILKEQKSKYRREQLRFLLFALCLLLFIYPFLSRMMETFGPNMIGGSNAIISTAEWDVIQAVCIANVPPVTGKEIIVMDVFSVVGSLFVCLLGLAKVVWLAIQRQHVDSRLFRYIRERRLNGRSFESRSSITLFIAIPIIAVSQLWTVFRLRTFQEQVSQTSGNQDTDGQWTFGQIVAVTIFVPVLVECWFTWLYALS
ncbi:hypothetical protein N7G274_007525 [Stereocaulon virgatum]|uniref:G protein-coupled receptor n=1 Tax=Stereocaulon virgatum TaxID=373712 RepID=A0ABR4A3Z9_9LECA